MKKPDGEDSGNNKYKDIAITPENVKAAQTCFDRAVVEVLATDTYAIGTENGRDCSKLSFFTAMANSFGKVY